MKREAYDCTGKIGPLYPAVTEPEWPMYSFDRAAYILWNAVAAELSAKGWKDAKIKEWLQSKATRWALDGALGDQLRQLGAKYAACVDKPNVNVVRLPEAHYPPSLRGDV